MSQDGAMASNTIFVRNLPYGSSDDQLQEVFADVGPVRKCFIVKDKEPAPDGSGAASRGFGFVQFALPEDAQHAVEQKQGAVFLGRKLNVELAKQRLPLKARAARRREEEPDSAHAAPVAPRAAAAKRQRPPPAVDALEGKRKQRRTDTAAQLDGAQPSLNKSSSAAARTVAVGRLAPAQKQPGIPLAAALDVARSAGELCSVTFPCPAEHVSVLEQDGCPGSIALLAFGTVAEAQSAVAALHRYSPRPGSNGAAAPSLWARQLGGEGAQVRRWRLIVRNVAFAATHAALLKLFSSAGFVWDIHIPTGDGGRTRGFAFVAFTCRAHAEAAIASLNGKVVAGRAIAVDWALSKRHYEAHQQPAGGDDDATAPVEDVGGTPSAGDAVLDEGALMSHVLASVVRQSAADAATDLGAVAAAAAVRLGQGTPHVRTQAKQADAPVTIFAHNLSPETTSLDLEGALAAFGRVRACRLVVDKTTGRSKGTAFIEFAHAKAAAAAVAAAADGAGIPVGGRKVQLASAVSKEEARALGAGKAGAAVGVVKDRRNLYLAREGEVLENSPAAVGVSDADMEKRRRAAEEKMSKLRNPNFSFSATRLHIRNLPASMDDKALRGLCINAVAERTGKQPVVKHARLLRDTSRLDSGGQQRSRGMGFVDFLQHQDALAALRALNNNPTIFGKDRRPIVEFALEDARAARKHELNLKLRARLKDAAADAAVSTAAVPAPSPGRRHDAPPVNKRRAAGPTKH